MSKRILITGATGKQGGATLRALLAASPTPSPFTYLAQTRSVGSPSAQRLASNPTVHLVQGDFANPAGALATLNTKDKPIWGYFLVTMPGAKEEAQGKAAVDAAVKAGVKHFVFASVERRNNDEGTNVPHFASKFGIERYLMEEAKKAGMTWTVLRPVCFMDNLMNNFIGKGFAAMYRQLGPTPLQLVASSDVGFWGAKAFLEADSWGRNRAVSIAGDELTYAQAASVFEAKVGRPMPVTYGFLGSAIKMASHEMGSMFKWFEEVGWDVDVKTRREENGALMDFGTWLEKESQFKEEIAKR